MSSRALNFGFPIVLVVLLAVADVPAAMSALSVGLGALLTWASLQDARTYILPDTATTLIAIAGLITTFAVAPGDVPFHILGALVWGSVLWAISESYFKIFGQDGLGLGDVKLLSAFTLWIGPADLASVLLIASLIGILILLVRRCLDQQERYLAFGPVLALSFWCVWLFGAPL